MSIITEHECGYAEDTGVWTVDLSPFTRLQSFAWRGMGSWEPFLAIGRHLKHHGKKLKSLTLDLIDIPTYTIRSSLGIDFADLLLQGLGCDGAINFASLKQLSLSMLPFDMHQEEIFSALNMVNLRALQLWNCPHTLELMAAIVASGRTMALTQLEIVIDAMNHHKQNAQRLLCDQTVASFLESFHGLQDLYLSLPGPNQWSTLVQAMQAHEPTLRRLVTHQTVEDDQIGRDDDIEMWGDDLAFLHRFKAMEAVGLCIDAQELVRLLLLVASHAVPDDQTRAGS